QQSKCPVPLNPALLQPFEAANVQICPLQHQVKDYSEQVLECALLPVWASINKACLSSCTFLNVLQRFFVNEAYWQHPDGPVFLYIGGEGPLVEYDVLTGHHSDMAEEHGALLLALEHRFYGDSINPDGLKTENLADLSSQQALVLTLYHQNFNLTHRNTWISFGGSYSGALSAWFRGKFPNLVYGAVASSAPVKAKLDFSEYNNVIQHKPCLADIFMGAVQYNEEGVLMSINELCGIMTNNSQEYQDGMEAYNRLVKLSQVWRTERAPSPPLHVDIGERQWTYQTCTEFGFYQSCEDATCPFSGMLTLQDQTKLCTTLFGISQHSLPARIAFTNTYYGGDNPHTHRILYVNGGIDPWKTLSVVQDGTEEGEEAQTIFIKDTAHCADMSSRRVTDRSSLTKARQEIEKHVANWLKTAAQEKLEKGTS
uniref:Serine protease 16 n=1 Tax=Astatotilapia calliptera TaxID=8154 RepID=A0A3P8PKX4_ASTCA